MSQGKKKGPGLLEYALIIGLVSLAAVAALAFLAGKKNDLFPRAENSLMHQESIAGGYEQIRNQLETKGLQVTGVNELFAEVRLGSCLVRLSYGEGSRAIFTYIASESLSIVVNSPDDLRQLNPACH